MNETFFYDAPEENWKNSEVARNFLELFSSASFEEEPIAKASEAGALIAVDLSDDFNVDNFDAVQRALGEFQVILGSLSKIASEAGAAGNVTAAYKIERAIEEIKSLRSLIWDPENN